MPLDFRYRRLGYVALNVTDVERSSNFYRDFVGLTPAGQALNGEHLFRCSERHHDIVLHQAGRDRPAARRLGDGVGEGRREHSRPSAVVGHRNASGRAGRMRGARDLGCVSHHRTEHRRHVRVFPLAAQSASGVRAERREDRTARASGAVREGSQSHREVLSRAAELPRVGSHRRRRDVHALFPEPAAPFVRARQRRREPAEPRQLHGHRHGRHRPRDVAHEEERGADRVRPGPASAVGIGVPVFPRPGRTDARIQLRHGGVPGAQPAATAPDAAGTASRSTSGARCRNRASRRKAPSSG